MKSLMLLWKWLAFECANRCCTSATMDIQTVQGRCKHEGSAFLTLTLPQFGKDFERGLDQGVVDRNLFTGFRWKGGLPCFLWGFLDLVFDRTSGVLLDDPDIEAIQSIRQLTLLFGKMNLPATPEREQAAYDGYIQCEHDVRLADSVRPPVDSERFEQMASLLFGQAFSKVDRDIYYLEGTIPKHGPGATAEKLTSNGKYQLSYWTQRLDRIFPSGDFLIPNYSYWEELDNVDIVEPGAEMPVRVISVPKTQKTPRIIGIEPCAMQYAQQTVLPMLLEGLFQKDYLKSFIGIDDQSPNRDMALIGSREGSLATLDLSEASDRVSCRLVSSMFRNHPHLGEAVAASRSLKADVPGHGVIPLAKFASMGSALCFPIEAMVFTTIVFLGIQKALNTSLSLKDVKSFMGSVRIYGDDIIVPVELVSYVISELQAFGLVVNENKSFWTGRFRESCGKEYYDGHDVSVVKFRRMFPESRKDAREIISLVEFRNHLYKAGYWNTARRLDDRLKGMLIHYPRVAESSPVLGRHSYLGFETQRVGVHLQNPEVRGYVVSSKSPVDRLDGYGALLKCLLQSTRQARYTTDRQDRTRHLAPLVETDHLERSGRPHAVNIKLRWSSPF